MLTRQVLALAMVMVLLTRVGAPVTGTILLDAEFCFGKFKLMKHLGFTSFLSPCHFLSPFNDGHFSSIVIKL